MIDKLHCPFCYDELILPGKVKDTQVCVCRNPDCKYDGWYFPVEIIQQIIDGKKAQDALKACRKHISDIIAEWNRHAQDHKPSPRQMVIFACRARDEITSITKQEE